MVDVKLEIPALEKLIEVVASGLGTYARPWIRRRDAKADHAVERIHLLEQHKTELLRRTLALPASPQSRDIAEAEIVEETPIPLLAERVRNRLEFQEGKRQVNIEDIVTEARLDVERDPNVSPDPVDEDWTARFFGHAQDVSSEGMKRIWGRILAGEVRAPGSFSVRCLDIVRNLSKAEAELFQHLAPYMIDDKMIVPQNDFVGQINYGAHLMLVDAGLMVRDKVRRRFARDAPDAWPPVLRFGDLTVHAEPPDPTSILDMEVWALSLAGAELIQLFTAPADRDYVWWACSRIARTGFRVSIKPLRGG